MASYISQELRQQVRERAKNCCEYCLIHQDDVFLSHEIDHIIAEKHRGETVLANLCLSCFECNRYKGSDIGSHDIETDDFVRLYNPRKDDWHTHFRLVDNVITPLTAIGRVTVFLLNMNAEEQLARRASLLPQRRYPRT